MFLSCSTIFQSSPSQIDDCRRLWVLDSGRVGDTQSCAPQLVVFDLDNDQVVRQYKFPAAQFKPGTSLFITPAVDVRDPTPATAYTCPNTMVYMADVNGFGLVVYDFAANRSWRVQNKFLYPSPYAGTFALSGETFDLMDGVFGLALTPRGGQMRERNRGSGVGVQQQAQRQQQQANRPSGGYRSRSVLTQRSYSAASSAHNHGTTASRQANGIAVSSYASMCAGVRILYLTICAFWPWWKRCEIQCITKVIQCGRRWCEGDTFCLSGFGTICY